MSITHQDGGPFSNDFDGNPFISFSDVYLHEDCEMYIKHYASTKPCVEVEDMNDLYVASDTNAL